MKYRLRFIIFHTLVVATILLAAMASIYVIYSNNIKRDFDNRLSAYAYSNFFSYHHIDTLDKNSSGGMSSYFPVNLPEPSLFIYDDSLRLIFKKSFINTTPNSVLLLQKIKAKRKYFFRMGDDECAGIYYQNKSVKGYVIAVSYDKYGLAKLDKLGMLILIATIIAIIVMAVFSCFYVFYITKPLVKLSLQMRHLNENNFKERFDLEKNTSRNDELAMIANNFNGMLERLTKAFDMQKNFVHHASHELRTPLAVMLAQTESALRKELTSEDARKVLLSLKEDQQEMIDLTNSLLLLSQYEQSTGSEWPLVRLDEVLYDTIEIIKRGIKNVNISIEFDELPEDELNLSIHGNEILLRSAFRNLIKNGYQYSDDRNVRIIISLGEKSINIHFDNNGKLVSEKEQPQLFIPFFRSINSAHKKGFGLGLSIVKRIISLHKGTVVYSIFNEDTNRFTVTFENEK